MKKLFAFLVVLVTVPAYSAVDIAASDSSANCDSGVLHSTTGPTAFQAEWGANTINLNWFSDSSATTPISVENSTARTCTYDDSITLPTNTLNKTGYTFAGWQVRQQSCFAGINPNTSALGNQDNYVGIGWRSHDESTVVAADTYGLTDVGTWAVEFEYGVVKGIATCNNTPPSKTTSEVEAELMEQYDEEALSNMSEEQMMLIFYSALYGKNGAYVQTPDAFGSTPTSTGTHCWCRVTSFTPTNDVTCPVLSSPWFYDESYNDKKGCDFNCVGICSFILRDSPLIRALAYGTN